MSTSYHKVPIAEDEESGFGSSGVELSSIHLDSSSRGGLGGRGGDDEEAQFSLKVLFKEARYDIKGLSPISSIAELKVKVFQQSNVPEHLQRFIFNGRQLKPDSESLAHFKVTSNSSLHLFPVQTAAPPPVAMDTINALHVNNANHLNPNNFNNNLNNNLNNNNLNNNINHNNVNNNINNPAMQLEIDPRLAEAPQAVKFWSMTLLILSSMELFNNFAMMSTGILGVSFLDSIVTLADTFCSILGVYVAQLGLKSVQTGEMDTVNEYVKWLTVCAVSCIIMRILWVIDLSQQMETIKINNNKKIQEQPPVAAPSSSGSDSGGTNDTESIREITEKDVTNFIIQASIIGLTIIYFWMKCVLRAYNFRSLVQRFQGIDDAATRAAR